MLHIKLQVITTIGDMAGLPVGTRIATNHNKLLISEEFAGRVTWSEYGELSVLTPIVDWLPVIVLPPVIDKEAGIFELVEPLRPSQDAREATKEDLAKVREIINRGDDPLCEKCGHFIRLHAHHSGCSRCDCGRPEH